MAISRDLAVRISTFVTVIFGILFGIPARAALPVGVVAAGASQFDGDSANKGNPSDPCHLVAATYFGGSGQDQGWPSTPATFDPDGNVVFAVLTYSSDLATPGAYDVSANGSGDVLVVKMNPPLTSVLAATYLGGSASESAYSLAIDSAGRIYIGGMTVSSDFPIIAGAYDSIRVGDEGFVAVFSADLDSLLGSTFVGGNASDRVSDIALGEDGSVYAAIMTASTNLITTPGAIRSSYAGGAYDFFLVRLDNGLTAALAATYLGGNREEFGGKLHVDGNDDIYLAGGTFSTDWSITPGAYDSQNSGNSMDGIIVHANKELTTILAATYIGGYKIDWIYCVDLAENGDIYVSGHADYQWPVTPGCFDPTYNGGPGDDGSDSFVGRISGDLTTLKASTFLGSPGWDWGVDILVDSNDYVYVAGETTSPDFPHTAGACDNAKDDTTDMFLSIFDSSLSCVHTSTFIGGSGLDRWPGILRAGNNDIYVVGYTESNDLTATAGAYDQDYNAGGDIYIARFNFDPFTRISDIAPVTDAECSFGAFWSDYDNDNYPDLFVTRWWQSGTHLNALYHNNGAATFTALVDQAPSQGDNSIGATWGDYDNDGFEDLFAARPRLNSPEAVNYLYRNSGDGSFTTITTDPAATDPGFCVHTAFADFDNDGDLDLLVGKHSTPSHPSDGLGFYRNEGGAAFVCMDNGAVGLDTDDCGAIAIADFDNDGDIDLMHARNMLSTLYYSNDGDGTFTLVDNAVSQDSTRAFCCGDVDNDGDLDLFGGDDWSQALILYRNDGGGSYARILIDPDDTAANAMRKPYLADFDNDGDLDLFVFKQGYMYAPAAPAIYINDGDGSFTRYYNSVMVSDSSPSSGAAWADYDRDGDLDVIVTNNNFTPNAFYRNDVGSLHNWISIKCVGTAGNRSGIGAKVRVKARIGGDDVWQLREISGQSGFLGQDEMRAHFGLGDAGVIDSIIVAWPGGPIVTYLTAVPIDQYVTLLEPTCGDANGDEAVNLADAVYVINYVFKGGPPPDPLASGDANLDGAVNLADAVYLINYIFKGGQPPCTGRQSRLMVPPIHAHGDDRPVSEEP